MEVDCFAVPGHSKTCAKSRVLLGQYKKAMHLFQASARLEFVAVDIFGELIKTPRKNCFLLVLSDRF